MSRISRRKLAEHTAARLSDAKHERSTMKELAAYLVANRRTNEVELIIRDIEIALSKRRIVTANVTTARKLSASARQTVIDYITKQTHAQSVLLKESIDSDAIGGLKIGFAGQQLDTTIKTTLAKLTAN